MFMYMLCYQIGTNIQNKLWVYTTHCWLDIHVHVDVFMKYSSVSAPPVIKLS